MALARCRRLWCWPVVALVLPCCGPPSTTQTGTLTVTQPSVVTHTPIPADYVWRSGDLSAWAINAISRNVSLMAEDGVTFIRAGLGPESFTLRSPDLPLDSAPIKGIRIVYRWQPSESRHLLNVFLAIAVPWEKQYADDKALLALGLDATTVWTTTSASPISSPGLPFVVQYVYFTAESTVTPGTLDISTIELVR